MNAVDLANFVYAERVATRLALSILIHQAVLGLLFA